MHREDHEAKPAPAPVHKLDDRLVSAMAGFAARRFDRRWQRWQRDFRDFEAALQLSLPWSVYHFPVKGKPIVEWFLEEEGHRLSAAETSWLEEQRNAWLSIWEVLATQPGRCLTLRDLLTEKEKVVREVRASQTLVPRDAILGRVVRCDDATSVLCGVHPCALPPMSAANVVERMRARLRRRQAIEPARLRHYGTGRYLIAHWEAEVEALEIRRSIPPKLQNTDGHDLLLTTDHFEFDPANRKEIERRLASVEGASPPEPGEPAGIYTITRPGNSLHPDWENMIIGTVVVCDGKLRLETNSIERADALRGRIEAAGGDLLRHRAREHTDPAALLRKQLQAPARAAPRTRPSDIPPQVGQKLIRESKERHYATWADQPLPGLEGKTPREAARTKRGRAMVDLILKDCENAESRLPEGERFDFSRIRRELGLGG